MISLYVLVDPRAPERIRYVGISARLKKRVQEHVCDASAGKRTHKAHWIRSLMNEGVLPVYRVIGTFMTKVDAFAAEQAVIERIGIHALTNGTAGGDGLIGPTALTLQRMSESHRGKSRPLSDLTRAKIARSHIGKRHSAAARAKMSKSHVGKTLSDQHKEKIGAAHRGRVRPDEWCRRISESLTGKVRSAESKRKQAEKLRGTVPHNKGKSPSEETRRRLSQALKGRFTGKSNHRWGMHPSDETHRKLVESHLGKRHSKETRRKMSESHKGKRGNCSVCGSSEHNKRFHR